MFEKFAAAIAALPPALGATLIGASIAAATSAAIAALNIFANWRLSVANARREYRRQVVASTLEQARRIARRALKWELALDPYTRRDVSELSPAEALAEIGEWVWDGTVTTGGDELFQASREQLFEAVFWLRVSLDGVAAGPRDNLIDRNGFYAAVALCRVVRSCGANLEEAAEAYVFGDAKLGRKVLKTTADAKAWGEKIQNTLHEKNAARSYWLDSEPARLAGLRQ